MTDNLKTTLLDQLSADEKALRDRELVEQAEKYFGGLTDKERELLGLAHVSAQESIHSAEPEPIPETGTGGFVVDWVWAALSALAFTGIAVWVLQGR